MSEYTRNDLDLIGQRWLSRLKAAEKRESRWIAEAKKAEAAYLMDGEAGEDLPSFNILFSNVETIVPSIYNSTPVPEIRPRHKDTDAMADQVSEIFGRAIATQIDDGRLDAEVEGVAQDAFMAGRGIIRLRFDADIEQMTAVDEFGEEIVLGEVVTGERVIYEAVSWRDYREGPAKRWSGVPWVAYRHEISEDERERLEEDEIAETYAEEVAEQTTEADEDQDVGVWEIWCKETAKVYFIVEDSGRVLSVQDDPLGLSGFFPQPQPIQPVTGTGMRTPVCPYTLYRTLAEELNKITTRINRIMGGLRVRGISSGDAASLELLSQAGDNEIVPIANLENMVAAGGNLDNAISWWPVEKAITVLQQLYVQREQTKAAIYELTGISDIVRGASNAGETATAQQIKTQWGSLRIKKMQRMVERMVREVFVLSAEIISQHFTPETLSKASGLQVPPEASGMIGAPLDHYRIDVETDSTARADLTKSRREMSDFLSGTAQFFQTMAPIVQQAPASAGPIVRMYSSFANQFNLGKAASDALDQFIAMADEAASQPKPNPEAEQMKAEMQMKQQEIAGKMKIEVEKLKIEAKKADLDAEIARVELAIKRAELGLDGKRLEIEEGKAVVDASRAFAGTA